MDTISAAVDQCPPSPVDAVIRGLEAVTPLVDAHRTIHPKLLAGCPWCGVLEGVADVRRTSGPGGAR